MNKLSVERLKELLEFYYEYDELVMIKNHIEYVINNINDKNYHGWYGEGDLSNPITPFTLIKIV